MTSSIVSSRNYLSDGVKLIDYVLVYEEKNKDPRRAVFLKNLKEYGFDYELAPAKNFVGLTFVKVHLPRDKIISFATSHNFPLKFKQKPIKHLSEHWLQSSLLKKQSPYFPRLTTPPNDLTTYERHTIVHFVLRLIPFGDDKGSIGLELLEMENVFVAAYPLHDGDLEWKDDEIPNDRQLLYRYWANYRYIFERQPMELIERYFGPELGYYFAFVQFYIEMLGIASVMGLIYFLYGLIVHFSTDIQTYLHEACTSTILLCPLCIFCYPKQVKEFCEFFYIGVFTDNVASLFFAIGIAVWGCVFVVFWKCKETGLNLKWNLFYDEFEFLHLRPQFLKHSKIRTNIFGEELHYVSAIRRCWGLTLSFTFAIFACCMLIGTFIGTMWIEQMLYTLAYMTKRQSMWVPITAAAFQLTFMLVLRRIYTCVAQWLTNHELHPTHQEYEIGYGTKIITLAFVNSYTNLIYLAFFKGKFYTSPSDPFMQVEYKHKHHLPCNPAGCSTNIFVMMVGVTLVTPLVIYIFHTVKPYVMMIWKFRKMRYKKRYREHMSSWEDDYKLNNSDFIVIYDKYENKVLQFGYISMFAVAFPFSPICSLIINILKIRQEAIEMIGARTRPRGKKVYGTRAWLKALRFISLVATITNAFYMGVTSDFIKILYYYVNYNHTMSGYLNFTLSEYNVDHKIWVEVYADTCYYNGLRYGPGRKDKYQHTDTYWFLLIFRLGFVLIIEHIVLTIVSFVQYFSPTLPKNLNKNLINQATEKNLISFKKSPTRKTVSFTDKNIYN